MSKNTEKPAAKAVETAGQALSLQSDPLGQILDQLKLLGTNQNKLEDHFLKVDDRLKQLEESKRTSASDAVTAEADKHLASATFTGSKSAPKKGKARKNLLAGARDAVANAEVKNSKTRKGKLQQPEPIPSIASPDPVSAHDGKKPTKPAATVLTEEDPDLGDLDDFPDSDEELQNAAMRTEEAQPDYQPDVSTPFKAAAKRGGFEQFYAADVLPGVGQGRNKHEMSWLSRLADTLVDELKLGPQHKSARMIVNRLVALQKFDSTRNPYYFQLLCQTRPTVLSEADDAKLDKAVVNRTGIYNRLERVTNDLHQSGFKSGNRKDTSPGKKTQGKTP